MAAVALMYLRRDFLRAQYLMLLPCPEWQGTPRLWRPVLITVLHVPTFFTSPISFIPPISPLRQKKLSFLTRVSCSIHSFRTYLRASITEHNLDPRIARVLIDYPSTSESSTT